MAADKIEVTVTDKTKELVIRTGAALPVELPKQVCVEAAITGPAAYAKMREKLIEWDKAHVLVDRIKGTIRFIEDEKNSRGTIIKGTLTENPELAEFNINEDHLYGLKALTQFLNMRRAFFRDREAHKTLVEKLSAFSAKIETEIQSMDDRRGNSVNAVVKKLTTGIDLSFVLNIPLYVGFPAKTFPVEIYTDVTDSQVRFYLESIDLRELMLVERDRILGDELKTFTGKCVVIEM